MYSICRRICNEERAQDLIEYSLLMAAMALVASGLMLNAGISVSGIWKSGDNQLAAANTVSGGNQAPGGGNRGGGNRGGGRRGSGAPGRRID